MISIEETILRLLLGAALGGIIGFEREIHGRAAGFRTQLIVCVAAVLIMIISENYYLRIPYDESILRIDPARIASGALIGIGFLGAGVIVKSGFIIRGLTTAASIWMVSAIGLAIGAGFYLEGLATTGLTVIALVVLRKVEKRIRILLYRTLTVSTQITENAEDSITSMLYDLGVKIHSVDYEKNRTTGELIYIFHISTRDRNIIKEIFSKLSALEYIKKIMIGTYRADSTF